MRQAQRKIKHKEGGPASQCPSVFDVGRAQEMNYELCRKWKFNQKARSKTTAQERETILPMKFVRVTSPLSKTQMHAGHTQSFKYVKEKRESLMMIKGREVSQEKKGGNEVDARWKTCNVINN